MKNANKTLAPIKIEKIAVGLELLINKTGIILLFISWILHFLELQVNIIQLPLIFEIYCAFDNKKF